MFIFRYIYFLLIFSLLTHNSIARPSLTFGNIDLQRLKSNYCSIDSSAEAYYIVNKGEATVECHGKVRHDYHIRIKILNKSKLDLADIVIPYAKGLFPFKVKASTFNYIDGKVEESKLKRKEILNKQVHDNYWEAVFTLRDVKEGSIIEYSYSCYTSSAQRINTWYFQNDIPVVYSKYSLEHPDMVNYRTLMSGYIKLDNTSSKSMQKSCQGSGYSAIKTSYYASNVPAFKKEKYMTSIENYISKIEFELNYIQASGQEPTFYLPESYEKLSQELFKEIGEDIEPNSDIEDLIAGFDQTDDLNKANEIYSYIQNNYTIDNEINNSNLRQVIKNKKGSHTDITDVTAALYKAAGFKTNFVYLSTRANGKIHPVFPIMRKFNHRIIRIQVNKEYVLLDPTEKLCPFGVVAGKCINGDGLVIKDGPLEWINIEPKESSIIYYGDFHLNQDGYLEGSLQCKQTGYFGIDQQKSIVSAGGQSAFKENYIKEKDYWSVENYDISPFEDTEIKETLMLTIEDKSDDMGNVVYITPILTGLMTENPFRTEERIFPVDFGGTYSIQHIYYIRISDDFIIESLPEQQVLRLPDEAGVMIYDISAMGNTISVNFS